MRRVFKSFDLSINRKIYYNLIYIKLLKQLNNLFKSLIFTLKEKDFKFSYLINDELANNNSYKKRILK